MAKYEITNDFKDLKEGRVRKAGEVVEFDEERAAHLFDKGLIKEHKGTPADDGDGDDGGNPDDGVGGLKHVGGGVYELPNGERVKGKEAAEEALAKLKAGE